MPIKFRCQKCRQLLGIAKSQAGAFVDCPQCGRAVRVPQLRGHRSSAAAVVRHENDPTLTNALAELSGLSTPGSAAAAGNAKAWPESPNVVAQYQPADVSTHQSSEFRDTLQPVAVSESFVDEPPVSLEDSLSELADLETVPSSEVSDDLLQEMRAARTPQMSVFTAMFLTVAVAAVAIAGSWWWQNRDFDKDLPFLSALKPAQTDDYGNADQDFVPETERSVTGLVQYQADNGQLLPDSGALVIALPEQRQGTLKLDGRTLRQPASHPDRRMTVAALRSLGGDVAVADDEGRYLIKADDRCQLVAISRYVAADSAANPSRDLLSRYFESSTRLVGELKFQQRSVTTEDQLDFLFSSSE